MERITHGFGYLTDELAYLAIEDMIAQGEVSLSEEPQIERYVTSMGRKLWKVTVLDNYPY